MLDRARDVFDDGRGARVTRLLSPLTGWLGSVPAVLIALAIVS